MQRNENLPKKSDNKKNKKNINKKRLPKKNDIESIDIKRIQEDYQVTEAFVLSKWDDVLNYCHSHGKKYVRFESVLRKFVKEEAIKLKGGQNDKVAIIEVR